MLKHLFPLILIFFQSSHLIAAELRLPVAGLGPAMGWENSKLNGLDLTGPALQMRLAYLINTYPALGLGLDAKFSRLKLSKTDSSDLFADNRATGAVLAIIVPFKAFGIPIPAGAFEGAGMPFYIGYNFTDDLEFHNGLGTIKGSAMRVGVQVPTPWFTIQIEYNRHKIKDEQSVPSFLSGSKLERDSILMMAQFPVAFAYY